jgi:hypothetical protein
MAAPGGGSSTSKKKLFAVVTNYTSQMSVG